MKSLFFSSLLVVLSNVASIAHAAPTEATPTGAMPPAPSSTAADGPIAVYSNTTEVEAVAGTDAAVWVATRGGLERYSPTDQRRSLYTTHDGLPSLFVRSVEVDDRGLPTITTEHHACALQASSGRFACKRIESTATPLSPLTRGRGANLAADERLEGASITARWRDRRGQEWLGTAGLGLWLRSGGKLRRLTPIGQVSGNHVVAIGEWHDDSWFATFDRGLTRLSGGRFSRALLDPLMLNDVVGTPAGLFVATSEGLYSSRDGESFERDHRVTERSISDLAYDPKNRILYATAINSLWEIALDRPGAAARATYQPGGSRSLQAVDVGEDGTLFLATEDRGALRRDGKRRFARFDRLSGYPSSWAVDVLALGGKSGLVGSLKHGVFPVGGAASSSPPLDPWILFLGRDSGSHDAFFIGTQGGAWVVDGNGYRQFRELPNPCVHSVARLSNGLWVGTEGGLALYR